MKLKPQVSVETSTHPLSKWDDLALKDFAMSKDFNLSKLGQFDDSTRENIRQLLNRRFGKAQVSKWRAECKAASKAKRKADRRFQQIIKQATQGISPRRSYTLMFNAVENYMDKVGHYFSETIFSTCGLKVTPEQSKRFIFKQLTMYRANSYNRSVVNRSGQYKYPDYWMMLTPLQIAVMFTNNPDLDRLKAFLDGVTNPVGDSDSIKDLSRLDHQLGKSILNCAFQSKCLNRLEAKTRTHLAKQIDRQVNWVLAMIELSRSNPEGFKVAITQAKKDAIDDVGPDFLTYLESNRNANFSKLDCIALVRFRSNQSAAYTFNSRDFDLGRLDHSKGYTLNNVGIQNLSSNRAEARARKNLDGYIKGNLTVLATLLSTDLELRKAEFCAGALAWIHQAQQHQLNLDQSSYLAVAHKIAHLNSQKFDDLTADQKFEVKNHIAFKEGITKFYDQFVPELDPYERLTIQGHMMPTLSIREHIVDEIGTTFAESAAKKIIKKHNLQHYAPPEIVERFVPLIASWIDDEDGVRLINQSLGRELAKHTKKFKGEPML